MAKELLPEQELFGGRFKVLKTLTFGEEGGVYTVKDAESGQTLLLKEVIPPASMSDEELERRKGLMDEALLILTQFEHKHLSKIYLHFSEGRRQYIAMERVDGITLKTLIEMSVKPLPEEQVLGWSISLCEALHYLHDRPQPFIFDVIEPTHIMMTSEGNLKLINYGIDRFFLTEEVVGFSASREELAVEMKRFAETLTFLLTRKPPSAFGVSTSDGISEPMVGILNRLLAADPLRTYASYQELGQALDKVLHPPPAVKVGPRGPIKPWVVLLDFNRMWQDALWAYLRQPLYLVVLEILGVFAAFGVLWYLTHPPVHPRAGPAAYVACGRDIYVIRAQEKTVLSRLIMEHAVSALAATPDGQKLFAAAPEASRLYVINTRSNRVMGWIPVERSPEKLLMDAAGKWLYVLHPPSGQVGFVQVDPAPLPLEVESQLYRPKDTMLGLFAAGPEAKGMALAPQAAATAEASPAAEGSPAPAASPGASPPPPAAPDQLYVSSAKGNRITLLQPNPLEILGQASINSPGPMVVDPRGSPLYVGHTATARVYTFQVPSLKEGPMILDTGGTDLQQLLFSPDGKELWAVNGSGTLGVVSPLDRKLRSKASLGGRASSAFFRTFGKDDAELWVTLSGTNEVVVVNPPARTIKARISVGGNPSSVWVVP